MVSETVIGAAIGVTGAVIGAVVTGVFNWFSTKQRLEDERMQRRADYFFTRAGRRANRVAYTIRTVPSELLF